MSNSRRLLGAGASIAGGWAGPLLDALLPQDCELCGLPSGSDAVCATCLAGLPRHGDAACRRCGDASASGELCGHCLRRLPAFDQCRAAFIYAFPVDRLVQRLKYGGRLHLARWWAGQLAPLLVADTGDDAFDLILPMPLHPSRLAERGFNQAVEVARQLSSLTNIEMRFDLCARTRPTLPQARMDRDQRLKNVRGAFECRGDLGGRRVAILDDVMTTGASLDELARIIVAHGASSASALVGARTVTR